LFDAGRCGPEGHGSLDRITRTEQRFGAAAFSE
jgi:hypothetical protein